MVLLHSSRHDRWFQEGDWSDESRESNQSLGEEESNDLEGLL